MENKPVFTYNDGGRAAAGYKGTAGDCVCRSIAIASGKSYQEVYDALAHGNKTQRRTKHSTKTCNVRTAAGGIHTSRKWFKDYMKSIGFEWFATMEIGKGCKTHLTASELPNGNLVVAVSKHFTAMIDGVIHDTDSNVSRSGKRCVYGYYVFTGKPKVTEIPARKNKPELLKENKDVAKLKKLLADHTRWTAKLNRANNALKKIEKRATYYARKTGRRLQISDSTQNRLQQKNPL